MYNNNNIQELLEVANLDMAVLHFGVKFSEKYGLTTYNLKPVGIVPPVFEEMDNYAHYEREMDIGDPDNKFGMLVRKQIYQNKKKDRPVSVILKKEIEKNGLGLEDEYYYYIIYRKGLLNTWGNALGLKKYQRALGFYLPFSIMKHIDESKVKFRAELVLVLGDGRIYTVKAEDLFRYFFKIKMALIINAWSQCVTGIPINDGEVMKELI
jgi:hypothetical protein